MGKLVMGYWDCPYCSTKHIEGTRRESWLLSKIGLLKRSFFHKYRRHAIVGLLVAAAFITPSSDPFTLGIVFFPLYGLFELSAFFVKNDTNGDADDEDEDSTEIAPA